MIKRIIVIISVWLVFVMYQSCCPKPETIYFDFIDFTLQNFIYTDIGYNFINYERTGSTVFEKKSYGMFLMLERNQLYSGIRSYQLINSACADGFFACPQEMFEVKNKIDNIKIITLKNFNDTHLKNSDVSGYFKSAIGTEKITEIHTLTYLIKQLNDRKDYDPQFDIREFGLILTANPTYKPMQFKVVIFLKDGTQLTCITNEITIE